MSTTETRPGLIEIPPWEYSSLSTLALISPDAPKQYESHFLPRFKTLEVKLVAQRLIDPYGHEAENQQIESIAQALETWANSRQKGPKLGSFRLRSKTIPPKFQRIFSELRSKIKN